MLNVIGNALKMLAGKAVEVFHVIVGSAVVLRGVFLAKLLDYS